MKSILKTKLNQNKFKEGMLVVSNRTYMKSQDVIAMVTMISPDESRFTGRILWVSGTGEAKLGEPLHARMKNYTIFNGTIELSQ